MKDLTQLTPRDVNEMDYNQLIGLTRETNRPPGGFQTVKKVCLDSFLTTEKKVLEIGTSTGFTAMEIARLTGARVTAIDINSRSLEEARRRAKKMNLDARIAFDLGNAVDMVYPDSSFDLVFCGNITSYVPNRQQAISEYIRVLKMGGTLAAVPMYYLKNPPTRITDAVSSAMSFKVELQNKDYWVNLFNRPQLTLQESQDYKFERISPARVRDFVDEVLTKEHLAEMKPDARLALTKRYTDYISLFAKNLSYMGYTIMLFRKEAFKIDSELFTGVEVNHAKAQKIE